MTRLSAALVFTLACSSSLTSAVAGNPQNAPILILDEPTARNTYALTLVSALVLGVDARADDQAAGQAAEEQELLIDPSVAPTAAAPQASVEGPRTHHELRERFVRNTFGPNALIGSALTTSWRQWQNVPPEWGRTKKGFIARFASEYGESAIGDSTRFFMARYLDEDPSFKRCECTGFGRRLRHAAAGPFSAYKPDGTQVFSMSRLVGFIVGETVARSWSPPSARVHGIPAHVAVDLTAKAGIDLLSEFRHRQSK
jgi:hypothetical protein